MLHTCGATALDILIAGVKADEHPAPLLSGLQTAGVDDDAVDADVDEVAMEPESLSTGFVAAEHPGVLGQVKAPFGGADLPNTDPRSSHAQHNGGELSRP